ncbi:MAG: FKBP-type peptidyl-prolyl cis-trans isomerase [Crocinitomicaceae bacterium]|nr:FKBP-type peptidyl-prolyl cis-trans isomerase [Crocinitomicaceae bacterium]
MKRLNLLFGLCCAVALASCDPTVVDTDKDGEEKSDPIAEVKIAEIDQKKEVADTLKMDNGIVLRWFEHGDGEELKRGSVFYIDYKVMLDNGEVVDGNHLLLKDSIPFPIGFQMQGEGWDIALSKMKVGDFVEVYLPSKYARGEREIKGVIPANSNNTLKIRVLSKMKPTRSVDGNKVWVFEENKENKLLFDDEEMITFHTMTSTPSNRNYANTYSTNRPFDLKLEDYGTVPGLKKALINAKSSDRMFIYVPSREAYGSKGYLDVVKPNEDLLYNVMVMDVVKK